MNVEFISYDAIFKAGVKWLLANGFSEHEAKWISAIRLGFLVDPEAFM